MDAVPCYYCRPFALSQTLNCVKQVCQTGFSEYGVLGGNGRQVAVEDVNNQYVRKK